MLAVILSGGTGTRLWPVSRSAHPKPFMRLPDGRSFLQHTLKRVSALPTVDGVLTLTNRDYFFQTADEYAALSPPSALPNDFLLEPVARNTAPAIAMAAWWALHQRGPETILLVAPADHLILQEARFAEAVEVARELAAAGLLVTFGIHPTRPETGYGYIQTRPQPLPATLPSQPCDPHLAALGVARFVEKPPLPQAEAFLAEGSYLWNSGMFCFRADAFLAALAQADAALHQAAADCWQASNPQQRPMALDPERFAALPAISVDYAVMERSPNLAVVACDLGWRDIGSWSAFGHLLPEDGAGNQVAGDALLVNSRDCMVYAHKRLVATLGVHGLLVVETPDAILIADKACDQEVKLVVERLKQTHQDLPVFHQTVHRPWGSYTLLEEGAQYKIKRISVKPGAAISLQLHYHRSEHWIVVSGTAVVTKGEEEIMLKRNQSTYIPAGSRHRLANPGKLELVLIEVQSGEYLGEDDIVRFEDIYNRV